MIDIGKLTELVIKGERVDRKEYHDYIKSFSHIIIWGAGNLGKVLGQYLLDLGCDKITYWDLRFETLKTCLGIEVVKPFSNIDKQEECLVVLAITNAFIKPKLTQDLVQHHMTFLDGQVLYQGTICPIYAENFDVSVCNQRAECNVAICEKLGNLMYQLKKDPKKLFIHSLDVYLTQRCSLACKYCYIYSNSYPKEKKVIFDTQRILDDIDIICGAASYIKRMVAFGGEPFLHPDIDVIVERMASKENVGIIDIISNGIFSVPEEKLKKLRLPKVRIDISNYNMSLSQELIKKRNENGILLQKLGLNVVIHNDTPQWRKPGVFTDNGLSEEQLIQKKKSCANFYAEEGKTDNHQTYIVKNGKFFACQHCDTIYNLGISDQPDYVELEKEVPSDMLIEKINQLIAKDYYQACKNCNPSIEIVDQAGEQGFDERYWVDKED